MAPSPETMRGFDYGRMKHADPYCPEHGKLYDLPVAIGRYPYDDRCAECNVELVDEGEAARCLCGEVAIDGECPEAPCDLERAAVVCCG